MKVDITIIGHDHTSLWLKRFLEEKKLNVLFIRSQTGPLDRPAATFAGLNEAVTRTCQTFGEENGLQLHGSAYEGFRSFRHYLTAKGIKSKTSDLVRIAYDEAELRELSQAAQLYSKINLDAVPRELDGKHALCFPGLACTFSDEQLLNLLTSGSRQTTAEPILALDIQNSACTIHTANKSIVSEFTICTDPELMVRTFAPSKEMIFFETTQYSDLVSKTTRRQTCFFTRHALAYCCIRSPNTYRISGANYLRRTNAWEERVDQHLREVLFPWLKNAKLQRTGIERRPVSCDGLPIIGPWPAYERLIFTGCYPENNAVFSFFAADIVLRAILEGERPSGGQLYSPKRFQGI